MFTGLGGLYNPAPPPYLYYPVTLLSSIFYYDEYLFAEALFPEDLGYGLY